MVLTNPAVIFIESNVQHPMKAIFDAPITPFRPQDFFRVKVDGEGVYVITRAEFQENFNDVLLDAGYRQMGYFAYGETPPKAAKYLKA